MALSTALGTAWGLPPALCAHPRPRVSAIPTPGAPCKAGVTHATALGPTNLCKEQRRLQQVYSLKNVSLGCKPGLNKGSDQAVEPLRAWGWGLMEQQRRVCRPAPLQGLERCCWQGRARLNRVPAPWLPSAKEDAPLCLPAASLVDLEPWMEVSSQGGTLRCEDKGPAGRRGKEGSCDWWGWAGASAHGAGNGKAGAAPGWNLLSWHLPKGFPGVLGCGGVTQPAMLPPAQAAM